MARRLGKRKRPDREKHMLKEQNKVDSGIFDTKTMIYLSKFYNKRIIEKLDFITARGKEADVYLADAGTADVVNGRKYAVVKFFRVETTSFIKMSSYLEGDPRFSRAKFSKGSIVNTWCLKEFGNLKIAESAGVAAPQPYFANGSILAMEFIGDAHGMPAPQLKYAELDLPGAFFKSVLGQIRKLYRKELVHADISEYNILVRDGKPVLIDFGQAVVTRHPNAADFLERDVSIITRYFRKRYGIKTSESEALKIVTG